MSAAAQRAGESDAMAGGRIGAPRATAPIEVANLRPVRLNGTEDIAIDHQSGWAYVTSQVYQTKAELKPQGAIYGLDLEQDDPQSVNLTALCIHRSRVQRLPVRRSVHFPVIRSARSRRWRRRGASRCRAVPTTSNGTRTAHYGAQCERAKLAPYYLEQVAYAPSMIVRIADPSAANPTIEVVWQDDGRLLSAASFAAVHRQRAGRRRLLIGAPFDDRMLIADLVQRRRGSWRGQRVSRLGR